MPMENLQFDFRCDFCKKLYTCRMEGFVNDPHETVMDLIISLVNDGWEGRSIKGETRDKHICPDCVKGEGHVGRNT